MTDSPLNTTLKRKDDDTLWTIVGADESTGGWVLTRADAFSSNVTMSARDIRKLFVRATATPSPKIATDSLEGRRTLARSHRALSRLQAVDDGSLREGDTVPAHDPHGTGDTSDVDPFSGTVRADDVKLTKPEASRIRRMARSLRRADVRSPEEVFAQQEAATANVEAQKIIANPERLAAWEVGHFDVTPTVDRELTAYVAERNRREEW
jgi:hypothetical protein